MARLQTTLGELDCKDLKILAEYKGVSVSGLAREFIKEGLDKVKIEQKEYFQNAKRHYEAIEKRWGK